MSRMYSSGATRYFGGGGSWLSDDVRAILVKSSYTPNLTTHDFLDDVPAGDRIGSAEPLTGKAVTEETVSGDPCIVFDANDLTFAGVGGLGTAVAVVLYRHTGTEATSNLIAYHELTAPAAGASIAVSWPAPTSGGVARAKMVVT